MREAIASIEDVEREAMAAIERVRTRVQERPLGYYAVDPVQVADEIETQVEILFARVREGTTMSEEGFTGAERRSILDWIEGSNAARPVVAMAQESVIELGNSRAFYRGFAHELRQWADMVERASANEENDDE